MKRNCWEVQKCGREPGGKNVMKNGVCPAATIHSLDGVHGGKNAGRSCWLVAGTWCGGQVVGSLAIKYQDCQKCEFFKMVKEEEGTNYLTTIDIIKWFKKRL